MEGFGISFGLMPSHDGASVGIFVLYNGAFGRVPTKRWTEMNEPALHKALMRLLASRMKRAGTYEAFLGRWAVVAQSPKLSLKAGLQPS